MVRHRHVPRHSALTLPRLLAGGLALLAGCGAPPEPSGRVAAPASADAPAPAGTSRSAAPASARGAYAVVSLDDGRVLETAGAEILATPVQPGSLMKIVTLAAALESGVVSADTRLLCPRRLRVGDRVLDCAHPDLGRPLSAVDALAQSCNGFFAHIAPRVTLTALTNAARALGLPALRQRGDPALTALGLGDYRVKPIDWVDALARVVGASDRRALTVATRALLSEGLAEAARVGTASSGGPLPGSTWAKTGTAPMPGGGIEGLAVMVATVGATRLGVVAVAPGAAGRDAAVMASDHLRTRLPASTDAGEPTPLRIGIVRGDGYDVRSVGLEDYVAEVVAGELSPDAPVAAREALAIVARTYASRHRGRHASEGFDLCDLTHCQALRAATPSSRDAARVTAGRLLFRGDALADVFYSASCGGILADGRDVWRDRRERADAGWTERPDPAGPRAAEVRWTADIDEARMRAILRGAGASGDRLEDLEVVERTPAGRVRTLRATGFQPATIDGERFRLVSGRIAGWQLVKSNWFDVARTGGGYRLTGRGHGHGVGLCVVGATRMAASQTATSILAAYFPGTRVARAEMPARSGESSRAAPVSSNGPAARPPIRLVLPSTEELRRDPLMRDLARMVASLEMRLGVARSAALTVRFHPTVESYQRQTRKPWWTAGSFVDGRIELLPLDVLESRGQFERTLRHELVHALTGPFLGDAPQWAREGVAHYFSTPAGLWSAGTDTPACPDDAALAAAASGEELRAMYDRAAVCVAHTLARGGSWRDLR